MSDELNKPPSNYYLDSVYSIFKECSIECSECKDKTFKLSNSGVTCHTGNSFVTSDETKDKKSVFDMELYYIIALGYNVIKSVKIVSDNLSTKQYKKFK